MLLVREFKAFHQIQPHTSYMHFLEYFLIILHHNFNSTRNLFSYSLFPSFRLVSCFSSNTSLTEVIMETRPGII